MPIFIVTRYPLPENRNSSFLEFSSSEKKVYRGHQISLSLPTLQARSSAWLEHHLDMVGVVGSSPIAPTNKNSHLREIGVAFFLRRVFWIPLFHRRYTLLSSPPPTPKPVARTEAPCSFFLQLAGNNLLSQTQPSFLVSL